MRAYGFDAVLALVGVPSRDGRMLEHPGSEIPVNGGELPVPVLGMHREGGPSPMVGRVMGLMIESTVDGDALVARGRFDQTEEARDYAGALHLGAFRMALDAGQVVRDGEWVGMRGGPTVEWDEALMRVRDWGVLGATVVEHHAWDVPPVKVYEVPVQRG